MMADLPGARQERFTTDDVQRREKIINFSAKSPSNLCNFSFFVLYYYFSFQHLDKSNKKCLKDILYFPMFWAHFL